MMKLILKGSEIADGTEVYKLKGSTKYILRRFVSILKHNIKADEGSILLVNNRGDAYAAPDTTEFVVVFNDIYDLQNKLEELYGEDK